MNTKKILLVEDDVNWQHAIGLFVSQLPGWSVVESVDNFDDAMAQFEAIQPDVVLIDWQIVGDKDGLAVGAALEARGFPAAKIILVSGSPPDAIPPHPYHYVAKQRISTDLLEQLALVS